MKHSELLKFALDMQIKLEEDKHDKFVIDCDYGGICWAKLPNSGVIPEILIYPYTYSDVLSCVNKIKERVEKDLKPLKEKKLFNKDGSEVVNLDAYSLNDLYTKD